MARTGRPPRTEKEQIFISAIGARVRAARKERGWTPDALAKKVGLATQTILAIERGAMMPNIMTLEELAFALNVRLRDLVPRRALIISRVNNSSCATEKNC